MTIRCKNHRCRHCYIDLEEPGSPTVCTADDAQLIVIPEARVFVLKCNTYLKRDAGDHLRPICPILPGGLFQGQLAPPTMPAELVEAAEVFEQEQQLDIPHKDRFYNTTAGKNMYVTEITRTDECST